MGLNTYIISIVKQTFENHCLILLTEAYQSSINDNIYALDWLENDFTEMLDQYIGDNNKRIKWNISNQSERHIHNKKLKSKGFADKEKRIDMKMSHIAFKQEYHFYIEAKRLKERDSALKNRYIDTGIGKYIHAIYPKGILVGYLLEGSVNNTIQGINDILNQRNRSNENLYRKRHAIHNEYFESTHPQYGTLQHLILDYTVKG